MQNAGKRHKAEEIVAKLRQIEVLDEDRVALTWKEYRKYGLTKIMNLKPDEFICSFLLHTLPDGFHRIRRFMAKGHRAAKLTLCRKFLDERTASNDGEPSPVDSGALTWAFCERSIRVKCAPISSRVKMCLTLETNRGSSCSKSGYLEAAKAQFITSHRQGRRRPP